MPSLTSGWGKQQPLVVSSLEYGTTRSWTPNPRWPSIMPVWSALSCIGASPGLPTWGKRKGSPYSTWEAFVRFWVSPGKIMSQMLMYYLVPVSSTCNLLRQRRLCWLGHFQRMEDGLIPKDIRYGELAQGKRPIGHPHLRFRRSQKRPRRYQDQHGLLGAGAWQSGQLESHCAQTHHWLWV